MKLSDISKKFKDVPTITFKSVKSVLKKFPFLSYELDLDGLDNMYDAMDAFTAATKSNKVFQVSEGYPEIITNNLKTFLYDSMFFNIVDNNVAQFLDIDKLLDKAINSHKIIVYNFKNKDENNYFIFITNDVLISKEDTYKINNAFDLLLKNSPSDKDKLAEIKDYLKSKYNINDISNKLSKLESAVVGYPSFTKEIELLTKLVYLLSL